MNREIEERILVLFSIIRNGGAATKKIVLDYLIDNDYIKLVEKDKKILKSRNEPRWRNMLAYTRQHLKDDGYLESNIYNQWQVNLNGYEYYLKLTEDIYKDYEFEYLSNNFLHDFTNVLFVSNNNISKDVFNDNLNNKNVNYQEIKIDVNKFFETEGRSEIKRRIGQNILRNNLLITPRCALCGIDVKDLLVASHVKPWIKSNNYERIDTNNALLLCSMHDSLFDKGYISFNNNGEILISTELSIENYSKLNINKEMKIDILEEAYDYFEWHRNNVFRK